MKKRYFNILLLLILPGILTVTAQDNKTQDKEIFDNYISYIKDDNSDEDLFVRTGLFFIDSPYKGGTLEINKNEQLVINLREFDCTTFIENTIALYRTLNSENIDFNTFQNEITRVRYRDGIIDGYASRLHYVTDWIFDNVKKGIITDKTKEIGGVSFPVNLNFMSAHPQSYPSLTSSDENLELIRKTESEINNRKDTYYYIPKDKISNVAKKIKTGDILFFTTSIKGLDASHVGIAYWKDDVLTFIHASSIRKKVVIQPGSLTDYCRNIKSNTGIIVVKSHI